MNGASDCTKKKLVLMNVFQHAFNAVLILVATYPGIALSADQVEKRVLGEHALNLQWLDNRNIGVCRI